MSWLIMSTRVSRWPISSRDIEEIEIISYFASCDLLSIPCFSDIPRGLILYQIIIEERSEEGLYEMRVCQRPVEG